VFDVLEDEGVDPPPETPALILILGKVIFGVPLPAGAAAGLGFVRLGFGSCRPSAASNSSSSRLVSATTAAGAEVSCFRFFAVELDVTLCPPILMVAVGVENDTFLPDDDGGGFTPSGAVGLGVCAETGRVLLGGSMGRGATRRIFGPGVAKASEPGRPEEPGMTMLGFRGGTAGGADLSAAATIWLSNFDQPVKGIGCRSGQLQNTK
jgi:hypothetical protein